MKRALTASSYPPSETTLSTPAPLRTDGSYSTPWRVSQSTVVSYSAHVPDEYRTIVCPSAFRRANTLRSFSIGEAKGRLNCHSSEQIVPSISTINCMKALLKIVCHAQLPPVSDNGLQLPTNFEIGRAHV